jgi:hypothetical protein
MNANYLYSKLLLASNEDTYGFLISQGRDGKVYASFWISGEDDTTKRIVYHSREHMQSAAEQHLGSALTNHTEMHKSLSNMYEQYINWHAMNRESTTSETA